VYLVVLLLLKDPFFFLLAVASSGDVVEREKIQFFKKLLQILGVPVEEN